MTAESTRSWRGQVILDIHHCFTRFMRLQKTDWEKHTAYSVYCSYSDAFGCALLLNIEWWQLAPEYQIGVVNHAIREIWS